MYRGIVNLTILPVDFWASEARDPHSTLMKDQTIAMRGSKGSPKSSNSIQTSRKLRSLELCVGGGGLALGTARVGFQHAAVIDSDNLSCETLRRNKQKDIAHVRDWEIVES